MVASFIGSLPGCLGSFTNVSLYIHGLISFGALTGAMAAASGDEAFVMLAMFPKTALLLISLLLVLGIFTGWFVDKTVKKFNIKTCSDCENQQYHQNEKGIVHYVREHVWGHIIKHHLWKTAFWTFGALLIVEIGLNHFNLKLLSHEYVACCCINGTYSRIWSAHDFCNHVCQRINTFFGIIYKCFCTGWTWYVAHALIFRKGFCTN